MSKFNHAVFQDNQPKYSEGDLILKAEHEPLIFSIVSIKVTPLTEKEKKGVSERVASQKPCCGRQGRGVLRDSNIIEYTLSNGEKIFEGLVHKVGLDAINNHLSDLYKSIGDYEERQKNAAEALGYSANDW